MQHHRIELTADHMQRFSATSPIDAVSELVWNSLDADAHRVAVSIDYDVLGQMNSITIADDGIGIPFDEIVAKFSKLGDSWKRSKRRSEKEGRFLHGRDGQGRFKALALGRVVEWSIAYQQGSERFEYKARLLSDDPTDLIVADAPVKTDRAPGVRVRISELSRQHRSLEDSTAALRLGERFALYLSQYSNAHVTYCGSAIDPANYIESREDVELTPVEDAGVKHSVNYSIIEWSVKTERRIYLCDEEGFPLGERKPKFHVPGFDFVGYIKSSYFSALASANLIELDDLDTVVSGILNEARIATKARQRELITAQSASIIQQWKDEQVYPYSDDAVVGAEKAERQVFDILAVSVKEHLPGFDEFDSSAKRFSFQLLRQAIESNTSDLGKILNHLIDLPDSKQKELAELLDDVSFTNIIEASRTVSDRLTFVHALEKLVYDEDHSVHLLERAQLHQLVAQNVWLFGEHYTLSVSDKSLTDVLRKHARATKAELQIDRPVTRVDGRKGIIDLMLSRASKPERVGEVEHLVIELKRPTVSIGLAELGQIHGYAQAVAADPRFALGAAEWEFWAISAKMDGAAKSLVNQALRPPGLYYESTGSGPKIRIWVKTWAEVINDAKVRMNFYKERLNIDVDGDEALKKLKRTYQKYFVELDVSGNEET